MARPTKLTPEIKNKILGYIRLGSFHDRACMAAGVDGSTMRRWQERGRAGKQPYADFLYEMEVADALAEMGFLATVQNAATTDAPGDWRARAFWAERRLAKNWGQRLRLQVDAALEDLLRHLKSRLAPDLYIRIVDATQDWDDRAQAVSGISGADAGENLITKLDRVATRGAAGRATPEGDPSAID